MEEQSGIRFGNYELIRRIDVGGMGEVYLAHQLSAFGRPVAIKIIRSDLVHDITARTRFLREAEVSAHLKHEHILSLYDFGEVEGRLFLATPYIEGGTLAARLKNRGPLSLEDTYKLFVPLVQAVAYIHRRGVIHRDLKPTNIMLDTEDGEVYVRLIDFGIASLQGHHANPSLTTAGNEVGTVAYMAPERLSGIAAPSNDIFSLGVILYQMLTAHMLATSDPPAASVPLLPMPIVQVIRRSTAANPAERYATAEELLKGFEAAYQQVLAGQTMISPPVRPEPVPSTARLPEMDQLQPRARTESRHMEWVSLSDSGEVVVPPPDHPGSMGPATGMQTHFTSEDYNATTTTLQQSQLERYNQPPTNRPPLKRPSPPRQPRPKRRGNPLLMMISSLIILLLVLIGGLLFYGYQLVSAVSVSVNFAPQVQKISQVFALKADPKAQGVDLDQSVIPAHVITISETKQIQGGTSGKDCPIFFACQQTVSQEDVNTLAVQLQQSMNLDITQQLQQKVNTAHGSQIGQVSFFNQSVTSTPQVNQPGKTVTVSLTESGSAGYVLEADINAVAQQQLKNQVAKLGQSYQMVDSTVQIGHPTVASIGTSSIDIHVPAGVVAVYQFSQSQLQSISSGLIGKSLAQAQAFLKNQPGIDITTIGIHFDSGNGSVMPGDTQHIKLLPLAPGSLPTISLPHSAGTPLAS